MSLGVSKFVGGPIGNAEWDVTKKVLDTLIVLPLRRRHLAKLVEDRSGGVPLKRQAFSRLLCGNTAFEYVKLGERANLAKHLEPCIRQGYNTNSSQVADAAISVVREMASLPIQLGLDTAESLRRITAKVTANDVVDAILAKLDNVLGLQAVRPFGPDEHAWNNRARPELFD